MDLLGEKVVSEAEADRYASRVVELLEVLVAGTRSWPANDQLEHDPWGELPRADVSVKPTALTPLFSPLTGREALDAAMARIRPVLDRARRDGATVHLDTEHDEAKDLGYELLRRMGGEYPDVQLGCVVQAYRRDSSADLRDLVAWSANELDVPLRVRLVKGAYWDHEEIVAGAAGWPLPVFARKPETDANFERCTKYLIDHAGEVRPAIASHNLRSLAHAIVMARHCELGQSALELQLLYGMAEPVHTALVRAGHRVRVYAPGRRTGPGDRLPGAAAPREHIQREFRPESLRRRPRSRRADPPARRRRGPTPDGTNSVHPVRVDRSRRAGFLCQRTSRRAPPGGGTRRSHAWRP